MKDKDFNYMVVLPYDEGNDFCGGCGFAATGDTTSAPAPEKQKIFARKDIWIFVGIGLFFLFLHKLSKSM